MFNPYANGSEARFLCPFIGKRGMSAMVAMANEEEKMYLECE